MSYEGYEVIYCVRGHRVAVADAMDDMEWGEEGPRSRSRKCKVCGETEMVYDFVDETNGCFCGDPNLEGRLCPAHETPLKVVGWSPMPCSRCGGTGSQVHPYYDMEICECSNGGSPNPACLTCYGTGLQAVPYPTQGVFAACEECCGRGVKYVKVFDLSPLQNRKRR